MANNGRVVRFQAAVRLGVAETDRLFREYGPLGKNVLDLGNLAVRHPKLEPYLRRDSP